jgi:hypothetical protein
VVPAAAPATQLRWFLRLAPSLPPLVGEQLTLAWG